MFKSRESMKETINYLQRENRELKEELIKINFNEKEYENLKDRHEKVLNVLYDIKKLATQNTYDKPEVILRKIRELSEDANLTK